MKMADELERPFCEVYREMQERGGCGDVEKKCKLHIGNHDDGWARVESVSDIADDVIVSGSRQSLGMALVGEEGPERVNLPSGSSVITTGQVRSMLGFPPVYVSDPPPAQVECPHCRQMVPGDKKPCTSIAWCNEITRPKW